MSYIQTWLLCGVVSAVIFGLNCMAAVTEAAMLSGIARGEHKPMGKPQWVAVASTLILTAGLILTGPIMWFRYTMKGYWTGGKMISVSKGMTLRQLHDEMVVLTSDRGWVLDKEFKEVLDPMEAEVMLSSTAAARYPQYKAESVTALLSAGRSQSLLDHARGLV